MVGVAEGVGVWVGIGVGVSVGVHGVNLLTSVSLQDKLNGDCVFVIHNQNHGLILC